MLTVKNIENDMKSIKVGDIITFDSMKECYYLYQIARSDFIKATGEVIENCGGHLIVKLRKGVIESVNYFDIFAVNGSRFRGYRPKESSVIIQIK